MVGEILELALVKRQIQVGSPQHDLTGDLGGNNRVGSRPDKPSPRTVTFVQSVMENTEPKPAAVTMAPLPSMVTPVRPLSSKGARACSSA